MSESNPYSSPEAEVIIPQTTNNFTFHPPRMVGIGRGVSWIGEGFNFFKQSPGPWVLTCIVGLVLLIILNIIPLVNIVTGLTTYVWLAGLLIGLKAQHDGKDFKIEYLFAGFKNHFGALILLGIIAMVVFVGIIFIAMGPVALQLVIGNTEALMSNPSGIALSFLIALALMIPMTMAIWFAPALIVLNDMSILDALKFSFKACLKNFLPFLLYGVVLSALMFVASIPLMLGWFVAMPIFYGSIFASYKDIFVDE